MSRSRKALPSKLVLRRNVEVHVTPAPFTRFESVRHLDVVRLEKARSASIELGFVESDCCRRILKASVRRGRIVRFELEPCDSPMRLSPEMKSVLRDVSLELRRRIPSNALTPPTSISALADWLDFHFSAWFCIKICCLGHCLMCCTHIGAGPFWLGCAIDSRPKPF